MSELVSVIVPIYKVEEDLEACVESIRNQTYPNLEIILVDDGSPDQCGAIADRLAQEDSRIRVIHKINGGLSDARNAGMESMTGDYVVFVDSDDVLELTFVEEMLGLAKKHGAQIAVCQNSVFNKTMGVVHRHDQTNIVEKCFDAGDAIKTMLYQKDFDVAAWGKIYRADTLAGVQYPKGLIHEDIPTTYKPMLKANKVVYTSKELYRYQVRENSIENEKFTPRKMDCITTSGMMLEDLERNNPEYADAARSRYVAAHIHILAQIHKNIPEKKQIQKNIKAVRGKVIRDKNASIRVRGACAMTYIGFSFTVAVLNRMNRHKYF